MANKSQNDRYSSAHLLPLLKIQELRLEEKHLEVRPIIQYYTNSYINCLITFHTAFKALSHAQLTGYSAGDE